MRIKLVVTVKAYPQISTKYGEVVCVAGIRTDTNPHSWVRLFPIEFRDLPLSQRFKKWQELSVEVIPHRSDTRPESLRPIPESIKVGEVITTGRKADRQRRRELIDAVAVESMCELRRRQSSDGVSLGVFRPEAITDFDWERTPEDWDPDKLAALEAIESQQSLFGPSKRSKRELEKIPYAFRYRYRCTDTKCKGHHQSVIDWELGEAYRNFKDRYGADQFLERLHEKWFEHMCNPKFDTHLVVGNMAAHPEAFLVLSVYWPKKTV